MSVGYPTVFVACDGALVERTPGNRLDRLADLRFVPGVFAALYQLQVAGHRLVLIANPNGLGSAAGAIADFDSCLQFIQQCFAAQGVHFDEVRTATDNGLASCLADAVCDPARSAVVGDGDVHLRAADELGMRGLSVIVGAPGAPGAAGWPAIVALLTARQATVQRRTNETAIDVTVGLDTAAPSVISTGIGFFDHMLEQLAKHGGFSLQLHCIGDLDIDEHHTVEDCALALGEALRRSLGDKLGVGRYGFLLPMDEAVAQVAIDLSGRAYFVFNGTFPRDQVGGLPTELVPHFFRSLAEALGCAMHLTVQGENTHHMIEACFKGVGRALRSALQRNGGDLPSTKGLL